MRERERESERRIVPMVTSFVSVKVVIVFGLTLTANRSRAPIIRNELKEQILRMTKNRKDFEFIALTVP